MSLFKNSILFNKDFFSRKKNDILFTVTGIILLVAVLWVFISSIAFLSESVNTAIDNQAKQSIVVQFNISSLSKLGIVEDATTSSTSTK